MPKLWQRYPIKSIVIIIIIEIIELIGNGTPCKGGGRLAENRLYWRALFYIIVSQGNVSLSREDHAHREFLRNLLDSLADGAIHHSSRWEERKWLHLRSSNQRSRKGNYYPSRSRHQE
jgi:hypothetical protein